MKKKTLFCIVSLLLLVSSYVRGDYRVWSSRDGSSNVEAQFIQMSGNKVVLEKTDGTRVMVALKKLSAKDQEFLASVVPPKMKIDVDRDKSSTDLYDSGYTTGNEDTITIKVSIKKVSREPSTQKFKAFLYVIAKQYSGDGREVIGTDAHSFTFEKKDTVNCSASGTVRYYDSKYGGKHGWNYEGYIVVVENEDGGVVMVDTNKSTYEKKLSQIKKCKSGSQFSL